MALDIVGITAYFRPEMLYLCLENLYAAEGSENKLVWIYHDRKYNDAEQFANELPEVDTVVEYWKRAFGNRLKAVMRAENGYYGNSYNTLSFYAKAYQTEARFVYLVEDDVLVAKDFFTWHEDVQKRLKPFCGIAGSCNRNPLSAHDFESSEYASLGVCWRRENLAAVIEHANQEYYKNQTPYILKHFPGSKHGLWAVEQDGLIQRVMEQRMEKAVWSATCRAAHVGVYGYHRSIGPENMFQGTLAERTDFYRHAVSDKAWVEKVAGFQSDVQVFPVSR